MINYADYDFYSNEYKGNLSIDLFNSLIVKSSREIDKNVNRKLTQYIIDKLDETDQYKLKYAACELCDYLNTTGGNSGIYNFGADSISIDGVSVSKSSNNKSETQIKADKNIILEGLPHELTRYL